jgi:hypothetical protein
MDELTKSVKKRGSDTGWRDGIVHWTEKKLALVYGFMIQCRDARRGPGTLR